jgi:hypothetical protein
MLKTYLIIGLSFISFSAFASELEIPDLLETGDASAGSNLVATCAQENP